jgi:hypothetical protein
MIDFYFQANGRWRWTLMGRGSRDRTGRRGGTGYEGRGMRGSHDDRWDPGYPDQDPSRDLMDIYEDLPDPLNDEYVWPENESPDED